MSRTKGIHGTRTPVAGASNWLAGWAPYSAVLAGLELPPRGPRGSSRNRERKKIVMDALRAKKRELDDAANRGRHAKA
jgi:hypothetical protein